MNFTNLDIAQLAMYVDIDGMEPEDAAALWLADNCARWTGWSGADASACPEAPEAEEETVDTSHMDTNGDGKVVLGVAVAGPRDDGAYYQALVDAAEEISARYGWETPIIIENIEPAAADQELDNLAAQGVDIIAVGAGEIADPVPDLIAKYPDCLLYTSPSPRDKRQSRMPSSA